MFICRENNDMMQQRPSGTAADPSERERVSVKQTQRANRRTDPAPKSRSASVSGGKTRKPEGKTFSVTGLRSLLAGRSGGARSFRTGGTKKGTSAAQQRGSVPAASRRVSDGALTPKRVIKRTALSILTAVVLILIAALGAGAIGFKGPSQSLGDLLTVSMLETSALKFVPRIYYSQAEVDAIVARNQVTELEDETDTSMIVISGPTPEPGQEAAAPAATPKPENLIVEENGIEIYEVHGPTYNGWIMVVLDPSRVSVGVCRENFNSKEGLVLHEIIQRYDAIAGINGGGFSDDGGLGNGGKPIGLVISQGEVLNKASINSDHNIVMGFNQDNVLVIGKMTSEEAVNKGLRDALAFGPALVVNGEAAPVSGSSSGLNPRTAIGQRSDGAVLMLVIDGRQASSLGATYADMINVLLEYGAVNACNLDGGSSSMLYYNGEYLNKGVILTGSRKLPTAFIVR